MKNWELRRVCILQPVRIDYGIFTKRWLVILQIIAEIYNPKLPLVVVYIGDEELLG